MKVIALTSTQQAQAASLKTALRAAQQAQSAARQALNSYLQTATGVKLSAGQRFQLTDDGTSAVITP